MSKVTVALPYYDAPICYAQSAIESLLAQDLKDWSAFVLDDSPNGSSEMVALIDGLNDPRLRYVRNSGEHGIGAAWNACLEEAQTELLCLLHTDDEYESNYLSGMVSLATQFPDAALYFSGATIIDSRGRRRFSLPDHVKGFIIPRAEPIIVRGPSAIRRLLAGNYIMCPTLLYRRSKIGPRRFSTAHKFVLDFRFVLGVLIDGETIVGTHQRAYRYRRHEGQATAKLSSGGARFEEEHELFVEIANSRKPWSTAARFRPTFRINAALYGRWGRTLHP